MLKKIYINIHQYFTHILYLKTQFADKCSLKGNKGVIKNVYKSEIIFLNVS